MAVPNSRVAIVIYFMIFFLVSMWLFYYTGKFILTGKTAFDGMVSNNVSLERFSSGAGITVAYYTLNGCPHCTAFNPEWTAFVEQAKAVGGITTVKYDARENSDAVEKAGVDGFPTIIITKNGKDSVYEGARKADALMAEVKK